MQSSSFIRGHDSIVPIPKSKINSRSKVPTRRGLEGLASTPSLLRHKTKSSPVAPSPEITPYIKLDILMNLRPR